MKRSSAAARSLDPRISVGVVYVAAQFMGIMDTTIVNVALPTLARTFGVPSGSLDAVVVGYLISLAVFIPASGWLGDRWGTKRIFLIALALFVCASALCGLATSFGELVAFRVLQGAGGGMLTPVGMAMLFRTFPPEQRVQASRILIIPTVIAPALGPVLGGFLVDQLSWRWVFYVNVPIGIAALLFGLLFLQEHREAQPGRFDLPGFLLAGSGFPLLMFAITEGATRGWGSPWIVAPGLAGIALLCLFIVVELRTAEPLIQLRLLGNVLFTVTSAVQFCASAGYLGILFLVPLFLQEARGASAFASGLTTFPEALGVVTSAQIVARVYPYVGPRRLMVAGMIWVTGMMACLQLVDLHTTLWLVRLLMFLGGAGMALMFVPGQAAAFATIAPASMGRASTLYNALRQLGAASGVAALSTVLALAGPTRSSGGVPAPHLGAYHDAFAAAAVFTIVAAVLALLVRDRDAAATMVRRRRGERRTAEEPVLVEL